LPDGRVVHVLGELHSEAYDPSPAEYVRDCRTMYPPRTFALLVEMTEERYVRKLDRPLRHVGLEANVERPNRAVPIDPRTWPRMRDVLRMRDKTPPKSREYAREVAEFVREVEAKVSKLGGARARSLLRSPEEEKEPDELGEPVMVWGLSRLSGAVDVNAVVQVMEAPEKTLMIYVGVKHAMCVASLLIRTEGAALEASLVRKSLTKRKGTPLKGTGTA
jgi:hypothetical protein